MQTRIPPGVALQEWLADNPNTPRSSLFITSKVMSVDDGVESVCKRSLEALRMRLRATSISRDRHSRRTAASHSPRHCPSCGSRWKASWTMATLRSHRREQLEGVRPRGHLPGRAHQAAATRLRRIRTFSSRSWSATARIATYCSPPMLHSRRSPNSPEGPSTLPSTPPLPHMARRRRRSCCAGACRQARVCSRPLASLRGWRSTRPPSTLTSPPEEVAAITAAGAQQQRRLYWTQCSPMFQQDPTKEAD